MIEAAEELPIDHPSSWGKKSPNQEEQRFLEGPKSRRFELFRAFRIFVECINGFRKLHFVGPCVTVFGSARFNEDNQYYKLGREVSAELGKLGLTIMTGGGPGIMEAANRGAKDVGAYSVGCNIILPHEQNPNPYLDTWIDFRYFFVRKFMMIKYSYAFIVLPGGFGTMDEVFETLTLIQTGKIKNFPIVLMGSDFWNPLIEFMQKSLIGNQTISPFDIERFIVTDSPEKAVASVTERMVERFGFKWQKKVKCKALS